MIDKKPFRVTNEQAKKDSDCAFNCVDCSSDNPRSITIGCKKRILRSYAADLLDSRELIDKQEAIIKEMREVLSSNLRDMDKIDQVCAMAGVHPYTIMRSEISAILEKTKDYA